MVPQGRRPYPPLAHVVSCLGLCPHFWRLVSELAVKNESVPSIFDGKSGHIGLARVPFVD